MSNAAKLKKKAIELEQKKQLDKALSLYIQFLQESDSAIDDVDIPLYNRVGDLLLRMGNASDALNYYERAVDLYAERGFLNNAIALCNKVLRQSPGRASIYYKLGKISATKGFKSDAKKNFLEYADRMQKVGQIDEAFRALKEFADLCPDQDDIRLMLAEQLSKENRQGEALEQLQKLHDKLDSEGRNAEARATVDRMKSIDPEAVPRTSGSYRPQKSQDLIFLDTSFEQAARAKRKPDPTPQPPPGRQVSDPDLVVLTLADSPDMPVSPVHNAAVADAFSLDVDTPDEPSAPLPLLDVEAPPAEVPAAVDLDAIADAAPPAVHASPAPIELEVGDDESFALPSAADLAIEDSQSPAALHITIEHDPEPVDLANQPTYGSGPSLGVDYAGDLAPDVAQPSDGGGLFDFRAPPRSDDALESDVPLPGLDPDVAFPAFDDMSLPSADEITSGSSLAAALTSRESLGGDLGGLDMLTGAESLADDIDVDVPAPAVDGSAAALDLDWPPSDTVDEPGAPPEPVDIDGLQVIDDATAAARSTPLAIEPVEGLIDIAALAAIAPTDEEMPEVADASVEVPIESLVDATPETVVTDVVPNAWDDTPVVAPHAIVASQELEAIVPVQPQADHTPRWEVQRTHAERLLEAGDRAGGVRELEEVAAELERMGDLEGSVAIVDELIRLLPDSVRHHQKRVELAFRLNDRVRLIDAYLELGDALFRSGEERKARAVYQRVFELAPDDPRAEAALESISLDTPATGSGSMAAIAGTPNTPPQSRQPVGAPRAPDTHVPYQPGTGNGSRSGIGGVSAPPSTRKPSPLDRSAASTDFVDLGEWVRASHNPKSTRMVAEEKPPTGDEQADFQEMLKRFKQGVAENVEDEDYESHYDLGIAYKEMGLIDEAVAEFQKALRGTSQRVRTYEALGHCFVEKEQYQVAASVLTRAIALGEGDDHHLVGVLYLLARATEALNKPDAALDYYQRVFAVDIEFRDVADRISAIEGKAT